MDIQDTSNSNKRVLITGISGFLASRIALELQNRNYLVRGTVRSKKDNKKMMFLKKMPQPDKIEICEADLLSDKGWDEAMKDCMFVLHVASPFPISSPKNPDDLIKPAVEGTQRVLNAAKKNGIKKVVITSSTAAIISADPSKIEMNEDCWSDVNVIPVYMKSKNLAEKAAWEFYKKQDPSSKMEVTVINPGLILGPSLIATDFSSGELIRQMLMGIMPGVPDFMGQIVDVRDVAIAEVNALEKPESNGKRFILVSSGMLMIEVANILREKYGKLGYKIPSNQFWNSTVWVASIFSQDASDFYPFLGIHHKWHNEQSQQILGIKYIPAKDSILEMAKSLLEYGIVHDYEKNHSQVPKGCC